MKQPRLVAFISHCLFSIGKYEDNIKSLEKMSEEVWNWGFAVIMPHVLDPWNQPNGKELNRTAGVETCFAILLKCDLLIFDINKMSKGVREEIQVAKEHDIDVYEIHYLRTRIEALARAGKEKKVRRDKNDMF